MSALSLYVCGLIDRMGQKNSARFARHLAPPPDQNSETAPATFNHKISKNIETNFR